MAWRVNGKQTTADLDAEGAIRAFLHILQRRLWLQNAVAWLWQGWRISAGLLVGAGLIHVGWRPVPLLPWLMLAALPPLLALGAGLWLRRPSLANCAWLADRRCAGRALLVSAWELLTEPCPAPASAPLILARAGQAALTWRQQLPARYPWILPGPARAALILSLGGIFLLATVHRVPESTLLRLMPESPTPPPLLAHETTASESPARPATDRPLSPGATPVARQALQLQTEGGDEPPARSSAGHPISGDRERSSGELAAMTTQQSPMNSPNSPAGVAPGEVAPLTEVPSRATLATVGSGAGVDAPGAGVDSRQAPLNRSVEAPLALRYVEIIRSGTADPTNTSAGSELEPTIVSSPEAMIAAAPPAERVSLPAGAGGPALRRYVAAYFATRSADDGR